MDYDVLENEILDNYYDDFNVDNEIEDTYTIENATKFATSDTSDNNFKNSKNSKNFKV